LGKLLICVRWFPPVRIEGVEPVMGDVPAVGQHTDAILHEIGIESSVVDAWRKEGII
jgi:itaconate CoA-transferase